MIKQFTATREMILSEQARRQSIWQQWHESDLSVIEYFNIQIDEKAKSCWKSK